MDIGIIASLVAAGLYLSLAVTSIVGAGQKAVTYVYIAAAAAYAATTLQEFYSHSEFFRRVFGAVAPRLIGAAHAESSTPSGLSNIIPQILVSVFIAMLIAFAAAVFILLTSHDTPENKRKIDSADNIVKTFGGFFIGFATSLLNIKS